MRDWSLPLCWSGSPCRSRSNGRTASNNGKRTRPGPVLPSCSVYNCRMAGTGIAVENPREAIERLGTADILVALPTYNDAETIVPLVKAAGAALTRFPNQRVVVAQIDGGSTDATLQSALEAAGNDVPLLQLSYPIHPAHRLLASDRGILGRDSAYRTALSFAHGTGVKACCIVEADTTAVTPEWIVSLIQPILESEFDIVAPYYQRHRYEGLLVKGLLYPAVRALFGKRLRQPVGSDFGFSAALVTHCLSADSWNNEAVLPEVDLWINLRAVSSNMKVGQVRLGARPRPKKGATTDLSSVLANLVGALYGSMEHGAELWQRIRGSQPVPTLGLRFDMDAEPSAVDVSTMVKSFRVGYENLKEIWSLILSPATLLELKKVSRESEPAFRMSDEVWARTVYDFAIGHRLEIVGRDHLLHALTPLYMGWAASFILSVKESRASQMEDRIEQLALVFEKEKPYLISRWRWPDRFMP
jgi:hypothetical protein